MFNFFSNFAFTGNAVKLVTYALSDSVNKKNKCVFFGNFIHALGKSADVSKLSDQGITFKFKY